MRRRTLAAASAAIVILAGLFFIYSGSEREEVKEKPDRIVAYVPPIMVKLFEEAASEFKREDGVSVDMVTGPTGTLLIKLESTREGDIFVTADSEFMLKALDKGLVYPESLRVISLSLPVLVVQFGNPAGISGLDDLLVRDIKIGIADPEVSPYGRVAKEILEKKGIYDVIRDRLQIYPDISTVAIQVRMGNIDVAILPHYVKYWYPKEVDIIWLHINEIARVPCQMIGIVRFTQSYELSRHFIEVLMKYIEKREVIERYGLVKSLDDVRLLAPYSAEDVSELSNSIEKLCTVGR